MYVWIILRFRVAFGRELRAGAECCARTWQLWRRASWKQVGDVTEGLRECELSRLGRLIGCSLQSWRRGKRRRRLYFQLAITILLRSVVMEHQQKMSFVVGDLCDRTVTHETVDLNLVFFFCFFCLLMFIKGILGCVFVVFVKHGYLPLWASFVVANNGTPAVFGKFNLISMRNLKGTLRII